MHDKSYCKSQNYNHLQENIGVNLCDLKLGNCVLGMTSNAYITLEKSR